MEKNVNADFAPCFGILEKYSLSQHHRKKWLVFSFLISQAICSLSKQNNWTMTVVLCLHYHFQVSKTKGTTFPRTSKKVKFHIVWCYPSPLVWSNIQKQCILQSCNLTFSPKPAPWKWKYYQMKALVPRVRKFMEG